MHDVYYSESHKLNEFVSRLKADFSVFVPVVKLAEAGKEAEYTYIRLADSAQLVFNPYRVIEPLKTFFTQFAEKVAGYFRPDAAPKQEEKIVIFGIKNCDLYGHKIQDFVFLEGVEVDAAYSLRRENTFFISGDCSDFKSVCHCLAWDVLPYPSEGFDLNLSPLNEGYLVEVGSEKGRDLIERYKEYFTPAKDAQISARKQKRENLVNRLKKHLLPQNLVAKDNVQKLMRQGYHLDTWQQFMLTCVECGGCNFICDTCHCFLLADEKELQQNSKLRVWDSCQYANYARVAGGANPLKIRTQRLRFRFTKKFDFFVDNLGIPACCGCGRCIEVCPGKIDLREVLKDLAKKIEIKA